MKSDRLSRALEGGKALTLRLSRTTKLIEYTGRIGQSTGRMEIS
jgi:hypothetical protein